MSPLTVFEAETTPVYAPVESVPMEPWVKSSSPCRDVIFPWIAKISPSFDWISPCRDCISALTVFIGAITPVYAPVESVPMEPWVKSSSACMLANPEVKLIVKTLQYYLKMLVAHTI